MSPSTNADEFEGRRRDDHELSERARAYGEAVVTGDEWSLSDVDVGRIEWATSTRAKRQNGYCAYEPEGRCTITIGEHVSERADVGACQETIRHELVHAWQHQHAGSAAVVDDGVPRVRDDSGDDGTVDVSPIEPGHGPSFRVWIEPLALLGRCATHYERSRDEYAYVFECPDCGDWWGRHRLCTSVRRAAHGGAGPSGYATCVDCGSLVSLRNGERYLEHGDHDDDVIRAFADGDVAAVPTSDVDRFVPVEPSRADD